MLNDSVRVDPYHELAHVALYTIGKPPAMLDEGFAVYVSKRLGADALRYLGRPGETIDDALRAHLADAEPYGWTEPAALDDVGDADDVALGYLQAASLVGLLATEFGDASLRSARRIAAGSSSADPLERSKAAVLSATGRRDEDVWRAWRSRLEEAPGLVKKD